MTQVNWLCFNVFALCAHGRFIGLRLHFCNFYSCNSIVLRVLIWQHRGFWSIFLFGQPYIMWHQVTLIWCVSFMFSRKFCIHPNKMTNFIWAGLQFCNFNKHFWFLPQTTWYQLIDHDSISRWISHLYLKISTFWVHVKMLFGTMLANFILGLSHFCKFINNLSCKSLQGQCFWSIYRPGQPYQTVISAPNMILSNNNLSKLCCIIIDRRTICIAFRSKSDIYLD